MSKASDKTSRRPPQQSDIVIHPDGRINVSFLYDDLRGLVGAGFPAAPVLPAPVPVTSGLRFPLEEYRDCRLCPRACGYDRTASAHPTCGDFQLRVAAMGLSLGDEAPISGSRGSGTLMLSGCPLKCFSCHNPEMVAQGKKVSLEKFIELCWELATRGAHNIQILSPTVHGPALRAALAELKRLSFPIPLILKSSGYERVEELRKLEGLVDIFLPDMKYGPASRFAEHAGVPDYFEVASRAISEMIRQTGPLIVDKGGLATRGVLIRHVRAPLPAEERRAIESYLQTLPAGVAVSFNENFVQLEALPP